MTTELIISKQTQRQFILGKQGLYPGRRWTGKGGIAQAIRSGCVIQIDPLNVVARSHDIALHGRILDYNPQDLLDLMYQDRAFFDYGGTVMIHPMRELPYWRQVMARRATEPRWVHFAELFADAINSVMAAVRERGPVLARDFPGGPRKKGDYRSGKDAGKALYYLWLTGELMTFGRQGVFDRIYDLRERIAPPEYNRVAPVEETERFFAIRPFRWLNIVTAKSWRAHFSGMLERKVEVSEAAGWLDKLLAEGLIVEIGLEGDSKTRRLVLTEDIPLLETLQAGQIPAEWQPLDTTTDQEVTFLAPLEIVSARGRALPLFDFEYLWEVYKPEHLRRWGYYTLPILYGDRLAARFDPKLDRKTNTLVLKGFWLEKDVTLDEPFASALAAGLARFQGLIGARALDVSALPGEIQRIVF